MLGNGSIFIVILDKSQWSDEHTLYLLNFLASRYSAAKLLMIVSYRTSSNDCGCKRLEEIREELRHRDLCREVSLQSQSRVEAVECMHSQEELPKS